MIPAVAPVRIAYFVPPSAHFAGIERVVHEIASGLMDEHGHVADVHVIFASRYDEALLAGAAYHTHVLEVDRLRHVAGALRALVAEHRFDVLVCPQVEASVAAWLATRGLGLPVFVTHLHGNPRIEDELGTRRTRLAFAVFRHVVARRIGGVVAVSPSLARYAARTVARHTTVHFAKNPVRALDHRGPRPHTGGRFRFLNVGRLSAQKGQDLLLEALALARPHLPPVSLTLVGDGPEEDRLRRLSRHLGLDDIVSFAGYTSEPATHFRSADCFVLASRWEGFGVVLVEALQFGLPLLATACDFGPADIITEARIGELVPADDVEMLAAGLRRAAARTPSPEDEEFRRVVADRFSRGPAVRMQLEVLGEILRSSTPRGPVMGAAAIGGSR